MPDIVITEFTNEASVADLARDYDVHYDPELVDKPEELAQLLRDARALIVRNRTRVDAALLEKAPRLEVVGRLGVGLERIDLAACAKRGVHVVPATGANTVSVAEYVIAALLILLRGAFLATHAVVAGDWPRTALIGREAAGRRIGLVGLGAIGRALLPRVRALEMQVCAYDPYVAEDDPVWSGVERLDLDRLLEESDVVSLHLPLTEETRHMIDARAVSRMKRGAILINAARGSIVDERALVAALREGRLGGAALDVFETEPVTAEAGRTFADVPNLLLTPHIAGVTQDSNERIGNLTAANVRRVLEDKQ